MSVLSAAYARAAQLRRSWYERRPDAQRRLDRPVISVGNLTVGGSGKTPVVQALARLLLAWGQRPVVLSRGYARRQGSDGVVVASDGTRVLVPVERSGDEPQMLARSLPGVPVLVSSDRFVAGRLAERQFGATVLLLDDGFQHLQLWRDVDLLLVHPDDLAQPVVPSGRLREPLAAASAADAVIVPGSSAEASEVARQLRVPSAFTLERSFGSLRSLDGAVEIEPSGRTVLAVSGIARPARFHEALAAEGWTVAHQIAFRDHHWFTPRDVARIADAARTVRADVIVTTAKDAVRLEDLAAQSSTIPWAYLPMVAAVAPPHEFEPWLRSRL